MEMPSKSVFGFASIKWKQIDALTPPDRKKITVNFNPLGIFLCYELCKLFGWSKMLDFTFSLKRRQYSKVFFIFIGHVGVMVTLKSIPG